MTDGSLVTKLSCPCHFFSAALSELSIGGKVSGHGHPSRESWSAEALLSQDGNPLWTADGMAGRVISKTPMAGAGESTEVTFTAPGPGTYPFVCTFPGHAVAGMSGTLVVR